MQEPGKAANSVSEQGVSADFAQSAHDRRPDIDILRAIAVLAVILFHFDVSALSGGFLGVDMFFVISGYLITLHLRQQLATGSFSFINFYARRIRRLFPALAATLVLSSLIAILFLPRALLSEYALSVVAASAYLSNVFFWSISDYFDSESIYKPLLHTWSLSVEEQFYIFWPLFVLLFMKRRLLLAITVAGATSACAALFLNLDANTVFYHFPFRVHEFALGALMTGISMERLPRWVRSVLVLLAFAAIGYGLLTTTEHSAFPGVGSTAVILGTAIIIGANHPALNARTMFTQPIIRIGLASYSSYLVHWPMVVFYKILYPGDLEDTEILLLTLSTLYLGELFYQWIEQPGAAIQLPKFRFLVIGMAPAMMMIAATFYFTYPQIRAMLLQAVLPSTAPANADAGTTTQAIALPTVREVLENIPDRQSELARARQMIAQRNTGGPQSEHKTVVVLGDSHAIDFTLAMQLAVGQKNLSFVTLHSLCDPLTLGSISIPVDELYKDHPQDETREDSLCESYHRDLTAKIVELDPDVIVFSEAWRQATLPFLKRTITDIKSSVSAEIVVVGRVPQFLGNPDVIFRNATSFEELNRNAWAQRYRVFDDFDMQLETIADQAGVEFVSKTQVICPNFVCEIIIDTKVGYTDTQHWTVAGMERYGRGLAETPEFKRLIGSD